ncbi:MAG TPA: cytochrome P450 [Acidimicrobiales bacterium]|nr:cytochrome P450 [Acidimicrobiales bacterium]
MPSPRSPLSELPELFMVAEPDWHLDLLASFTALVERTDAGLLRVGGDEVVAFRYRDVKALATTPEAGNTPVTLLAAASQRREGHPRAVPEAGGGFFGMLADQAFTHNPPLHEHTRRALGRQLLLHNTERFRPSARAVMAELLSSLEGRREVDFARDVARPYAVRFFGEMLGMTVEEAEEVSALMREMSAVFLLERSPADSARIDGAADRYVALVEHAAGRPRRGPGAELVAEMRADIESIEVEGRPASIGRFLAANLFDGFHTVAVAVANCWYCLLAAGMDDALRADRGLVASAVVEGLRLAPPLLLTHRQALADLVHDGVEIPAGTSIAMLWGSPNRDPEAWSDPAAYRLDRDRQVLFSFGGGPHLCPGRNAARMLCEVALEALVSCGARWRLAEHGYRFVPASAMRELVAFPLEISWG